VRVVPHTDLLMSFCCQLISARSMAFHCDESLHLRVTTTHC